MSQREHLLGVSSTELRDISVSPCRVQTPNQRFGDGTDEVMRARCLVEMQMMMNPYAEDTPSDSDSDSDAAGGVGPGYLASKPARRKPPKLQNLRMNLTALSQVYNLYFAAYRGQIWVYCPVGPMAQGLGEEPALVIHHRVTSVGARMPSRIPGWSPDEANHMIVGFLGDLEILLLCFENGDVEAYYTREIAACITHHARYPSSVPRQPPRPFFVDNVGDSAWGLAIHSKSRLIAVSSNRPEVTVFAFSLIRAPPPGRVLKTPHSPFEAAVLARKRNWRILLPLKLNGHNIPNIDFVSSPLGHAQKVSAVDINGNFWLLDIWRQGTAPALIVPQDTSWGNLDLPRLWAVVALPESSFLDSGKCKHSGPKAYFSRDASHARAIALGIRDIPIQLPFRNSRYWIDTSGALALIPDCTFTGRTQPYLFPNVPNPSVIAGNTLVLNNATLAAALAAEDEDSAEDGGEGEHSYETEEYDDEGDDEYDDDGNGLDEGGYDEADLEVEVSSSADSPDDHAGNTGQGYELSLDPFTGEVIAPNVSPPFLVGYLPNETDQPYEPPAVFLNNVQQHADTQKRLGAASIARLPEFLDRLPEGATEQWEGKADGQRVPRMGMIYVPHQNMTYREPSSISGWVSWLRRRKEYNLAATEQDQDEIALIGEHTSFFVADKMDLRLMTPNRRFVDIYSRGPAVDMLSSDYTRVRRVNMTLHVPELNLVVAACQSGRVALVSLIKAAWALPTVCGDRCMRVDKILPTASEEDKRRVRPDVSLFGIAMGPVQEADDGTLRLRSRKVRESFSPRYRLILHYRDHTILSYLVSRPSPDDLQVI